MRGFRLLRLYAVLSVALCSSIGCSRPSDDDVFSLKLAKIDALIGAGEEKAALKNLATLEKKAVGARQWLSIAKREFRLESYGTAERTLRTALALQPANAEITATLVDALILQEKFSDARRYTASLSGTPYETLAAYAEFAASLHADFSAIEPRYWLIAAHALGDARYSHDAAVVSALRGDFASACATVISFPEDRLFSATLFYDAGFPDKALSQFSGLGINLLSLEETQLVADVSWDVKDIAGAREAWTRIVAAGQDASATALYDLAVTETDPILARGYLESALSAFPSFYPAVVRYARSVSLGPAIGVFDGIEAELDRSGIRTVEMERKVRVKPIETADAARAVGAAIDASSGAVDMRLRIERIRVASQASDDRSRWVAAVWRLLEDFPDDAVLRDWARWFFMASGEFSSAEGLCESPCGADDAFYAGLKLAGQGELAEAESAFEKMSGNSLNSCAALGNIGRLKEKAGDIPGAIESFSAAAGFAPDDRTASRMHYEAARILADAHDVARAKSILGYALQLDPSNYLADRLLKTIESSE